MLIDRPTLAPPPRRRGTRLPATNRRALAQRLRREIDGEVLFDAASRGRYATDASIYQIEPVGVVVPRSDDDVARRDRRSRASCGVPVLPRGAGTLAVRPDGRRRARHRPSKHLHQRRSRSTRERDDRRRSSPASCSTS